MCARFMWSAQTERNYGKKLYQIEMYGKSIGSFHPVFVFKQFFSRSPYIKLLYRSCCVHCWFYLDWIPKMFTCVRDYFIYTNTQTHAYENFIFHIFFYLSLLIHFCQSLVFLSAVFVVRLVFILYSRLAIRRALLRRAVVSMRACVMNN